MFQFLYSLSADTLIGQDRNTGTEGKEPVVVQSFPSVPASVPTGTKGLLGTDVCVPGNDSFVPNEGPLWAIEREPCLSVLICSGDRPANFC